MEWLDANQVNFRGQLPKIMTWSNLLQCEAQFGTVHSVCRAFTFKGGHNSGDAQGDLDSPLQITKLCTVVHLSKDKIFHRK